MWLIDILRIPLSFLGDIYVSTVLLLTCFLRLWCSVWINTLDFLNQALFIIPRMTWSSCFDIASVLIHCFTSCIDCVLCVCDLFTLMFALSHWYNLLKLSPVFFLLCFLSPFLVTASSFLHFAILTCAKFYFLCLITEWDFSCGLRTRTQTRGQITIHDTHLLPESVLVYYGCWKKTSDSVASTIDLLIFSHNFGG